MPTPIWQPGTIYPPGSIVQPASAPAPQPDPLDNGGFEEGNTGWAMDAGFSIGEFGNGTHFQGTWSLQWDLTGDGHAINAEATEVTPGQTINGSCQVQQGASSSGQAGARVEILWYDASDEFLSSTLGNMVNSTSNQNWKQSSVSAVAPAGAAFARFAVFAFRLGGGAELWVDNCTWDAMVTNLPTGLVFKAVQAVAGYSGSSEPTWPLVNGMTVVDNEVTWEAVYASRVVWEASPVLVSGEYEPEWPTIPGGEVADGTIRWVAMNWRVTDPKCPQKPIAAIEASKIFNGDDDIIAFCATTNPLDWSSEEDAGFLPFGLKTYGANPVAHLGLYRSNLLAFNAMGYQMWQVDEDPANMAYLDAEPVPCTFEKGGQPVSNDYAMVTPVGIRSVGIAGGSQNLQAGYFGAPIDPLVAAKLNAGEVPITLTWPAAGQMWTIFGAEVFVLTMNGSQKDWSWSRYLFPYPITDWTVKDEDLYLRVTTTDSPPQDLIWKMDAEALADDVVCSPDAPVLSGELDELSAVLTWTAPDGGPISAYRLYNAVTAELIVEIDELTYPQSGLDVDETYSYYVTALGVNDSESEPSNTVVLTTASLSAPVLSGVSEDIGGGDFTNALEWTASTPAYAVTGYRLYNAEDDTLIVQQPGLTFDDTPIGLGVTKAYYVRAYGPGGGMSDPSNIVILDTGDTATVIDIFFTSGTWTKRPNLVSIDYDVLAAGAGAASGSHAVANGNARGGKGGGGGEWRGGSIDAGDLGDTEDVAVGLGGVGGAPVLSGNTNGNPGTDGGDSSFGAHALAKGGKGGTHPGGPGGAGGSGGSGGSGENGGAGSAQDTRTPPDTPGGSTSKSGPGGGGGGGHVTGPSAHMAGATGGSSDDAAGGAGGPPGSNGVPASDGSVGGSSSDGAGGGGGGGGSGWFDSGTGDPYGGDGADGGDYGAGGGGGGAGLSNDPSGAGGDGADGITVIINHLSV